MRPVFLIFPVLATLSSPAAAQMDFQSISNWQLSSNIATVNGIMNEQVLAGRRPSTVRTTPSPRLQFDGGSTRVISLQQQAFALSADRRRANYAQYAANVGKDNPAAGVALRKLFASRDILAEMGPQLAKYGFRMNNVADAFAVWWMQSWAAVRENYDDATPAQARAVRGQAARAIAASPVIASGSDAKKQEFAETLLLQTAFMAETQNRAKSDPRLARQLADGVRKSSRAMGLDLDAMALTSEGFKPI